MAFIIKKVSLPSGIEVTDVYARIEPFSGNKNIMNGVINYYIDKKSADEGKINIKSYSFCMVPSVNDDAPNFIKQCYDYLKTLPEFADTIDVLE